ncbi:MAG: ABC transporter permease [Gemmataceae bacterium]
MDEPAQKSPSSPRFGWLTDRENRQAIIGATAWLAVGLLLSYYLRSASIGTALLFGSLWLLSLAVFARRTIQNLFGPVFLYETVRVGRRRFTFILRTIYLLVLTMTLTMVFLTWLGQIGYWLPGFMGIRPNQLSQYGELAFQYFAPIQFGFICLITPAYVAGIIADEKERKTLEFLFATDLQNREIVFGKLAARIVTLIMYIIAGLPILSSLMLFGGIDPELLLAVYACTIITMLSLASLSIFFSTNCRKPRDAIVLTYFMAALYFLVTLIAPVFMSRFSIINGGPLVIAGWEVPIEWLGACLGAGNPLFALIAVFGLGFTIEDVVGKFILTNAVFIVSLLTYSILRLRAIALQQSYGMAGVGKKGKKRERKASSRPHCGTDPVFWKEVFVEGSHRRGWSMIAANILLVIMTYVWVALIFFSAFFDSNYQFAGFTVRNLKTFQDDINVWLRLATGVLSFLMIMGAIVRGASTVTSEKDRDTWISLISSPLSSWEILIGKWWGTVLSTRRFGWILLSVWVFSMLVGSVNPFMIIPTVIYLAVYIATFAWMGMLCSCTARNTLIASIRAMMVGLFFSGGFWLLLACCCFMPMSIGGGRGDFQTTQFIAMSALSLTPPFVMGWLPLNSFEHRDMGPFHPNESPHFGPTVVILGVFIWSGFALMLAMSTMAAFRRLANRTEDDYREKKPTSENSQPEY